MLPNAAITEHYPMVQAFAHQLARRLPRHVDVNELVAAGALGLVEAAARYDESKGVAFGEFARRRVHGAMLDVLRSDAASTRGSRRRRREVEERRRELSARLGRPAESHEIAESLGVSVAEVEKEPLRLLSLDALGIEEDAQSRVVEALISPEASADALIAAREGRERITQALTQLTERQQMVLSLYYVEELKLREIGELLGVSESRVCQIHTGALKALRALLE